MANSRGMAVLKVKAPVDCVPVEMAEKEGRLCVSASLPSPKPPENMGMRRRISKPGPETIGVPSASHRVMSETTFSGASGFPPNVAEMPLTPPEATKRRRNLLAYPGRAVKGWLMRAPKASDVRS